MVTFTPQSWFGVPSTMVGGVNWWYWMDPSTTKTTLGFSAIVCLPWRRSGLDESLCISTTIPRSTQYVTRMLFWNSKRRRSWNGQIEVHTWTPWASCHIRKIATCVTHVPWCMPGSLTSGFLWNRWRGKRSRHSRRMRNPRFCVSGKRPIVYVWDQMGVWIRSMDDPLLLCQNFSVLSSKRGLQFIHYHFTKQTKGIMHCHDRLMKFKTNRYYSKNDEIHLGLGIT